MNFLSSLFKKPPSNTPPQPNAQPQTNARPPSYQQGYMSGPRPNSSAQQKNRSELLIDIPTKARHTPVQTNPQAQLSPEQISNLVHFKLEAAQNEIVSGSKNVNLPVMATVKVDHHETTKRLGLDLILVIDVSGSMSGEKINLVRKTINFVIDSLEECDRLCLISFNRESKILTNLMPLTQENKDTFHLKASQINASGDTNIVAGLRDAFDIMINRKQVNDLTSVFLLSDGQDTCGNSKQSFVPFLTEKNKAMGLNDYKIHSYGYGEGHDEDVLSIICSFKNGNFYYVRNLKSVDECFVACLGTILSSFSNYARAELLPTPGVTFVQTFGQEWGPKEALPLQLELRSLAFDVEKHYMAKIEIKEVPTFGTDFVLIRGTLFFVIDEIKMKKEAELRLRLVANQSQIGETVKTVFDNLVRVEAAQVLRDAEEDIDRGNEAEAYNKIDRYNVQMDKYNLSEDVKKKMKNIVVKTELQSKKDMKQYSNMLSNEEYVPCKVNLMSLNSGQERYMKKLKK